MKERMTQDAKEEARPEGPDAGGDGAALHLADESIDLPEGSALPN